MLKKYFSSISLFLLILLWVYAATSKLIDFPHFRYEMHNQVLYPFIQDVVIFLLPVTELLTATFLMFERTQMMGLYLSLLMMSVFTGYIFLVIVHAFRKVPCSCGGILENLGWNAHLIFNLIFLTLIIITLIIIKRKEETA